MFTIVEVFVKKFSLFQSRYSNEDQNVGKPKSYGVSLEIDSDLSLNNGQPSSLIGGCDEMSAQVKKIKILIIRF